MSIEIRLERSKQARITHSSRASRSWKLLLSSSSSSSSSALLATHCTSYKILSLSLSLSLLSFFSFLKHKADLSWQAVGTPKVKLSGQGPCRTFTCTSVGLNPEPFPGPRVPDKGCTIEPSPLRLSLSLLGVCFSGTLLGLIIICAFGYQQNVGFVKKHECLKEIYLHSV